MKDCGVCFVFVERCWKMIKRWLKRLIAFLAFWERCMLCISNSWFLTSKPSSIYRGEILAAHSWNTAGLALIQILICAPNLLLKRNHEYLHYQIDLALFRSIFIKFQHLHKSLHTFLQATLLSTAHEKWLEWCHAMIFCLYHLDTLRKWIFSLMGQTIH